MLEPQPRRSPASSVYECEFKFGLFEATTATSAGTTAKTLTTTRESSSSRWGGGCCLSWGERRCDVDSPQIASRLERSYEL
eukprot:scaffold51799_cov56-Attheya_sp.AAC.3